MGPPTHKALGLGCVHWEDGHIHMDGVSGCTCLRPSKSVIESGGDQDHDGKAPLLLLRPGQAMKMCLWSGSHVNGSENARRVLELLPQVENFCISENIARSQDSCDSKTWKY